MNGWIKLYRSILYHPHLGRDHVAKNTFITLLLLVDHETGVWKGGRFQLARFTGLYPSTQYDALIRLKGWQMIDIKPGKRYSTYTIVNWHEYQAHPNTLAVKRSTLRPPLFKEVRSKKKDFIDPLGETKDPFREELSDAERTRGREALSQLRDELSSKGVLDEKDAEGRENVE
jgi:hypothetical protein